MSQEALESLINGSLDAIEDLPDFANLQLGAYILVGKSAELVEIGKKHGIRTNFIVKEVMEMGEGRTPPKIGDIASFSYTDEFGIKKFKKTFLEIMKTLNCSSISEFMDKFPDMEFNVAVKEKPVEKNGVTKTYGEIQTITLT